MGIAALHILQESIEVPWVIGRMLMIDHQLLRALTLVVMPIDDPNGDRPSLSLDLVEVRVKGMQNRRWR